MKKLGKKTKIVVISLLAVLFTFIIFRYFTYGCISINDVDGRSYRIYYPIGSDIEYLRSKREYFDFLDIGPLCYRLNAIDDKKTFIIKRTFKGLTREIIYMFWKRQEKIWLIMVFTDEGFIFEKEVTDFNEAYYIYQKKCKEQLGSHLTIPIK